ncbi:MAG: PD-(D/E)XK nuclease family protein [Fusobacterium sp.]
MDIKYFQYQDNFLKKIKSDEKTIIVFSDYSLKNTYMRNREKNILKPEGMLLTLDEFNKYIFKTNRKLLTDAKRPLTFYQNLNKKIKEELNIKNYYDIIDLADLFFKYYREKNLSLVSNIKNLQKWQSEYINRFDRIKTIYDEFSNEKNYLPSDWLESYENFNRDFFNSYERVIFVDIFEFSNLHKKIIREIEDKIQVSLLLQCKKDDYNEELLKLEKVSLDGIKNIQVQIYEANENLEEMLNLIFLHGKGDNPFDIFTPNPERNNFHKILPRYFKSQRLKVLDDTKLYRFMSNQCDFLNSIEFKKEEGIGVEVLVKCLNDEIFCKIYNINGNILNFYKILIENEYRYLNKNTIGEENIGWIFKRYNYNSEEMNDFREGFYKIYDDLQELSNYKSIDEFYNYLKRIGLEKFQEIQYKDLMEKFYEVLGNIKSSERLCGEVGFNGLFKENVGASIYKLLIKYLEGIEIREVEREKSTETVGLIKNLMDARLNYNKDSYFIDITNENLPGNIKDSFVFTESQREENNFPTLDDKINILKQRFVQGIFNSRESIIFTKKNEEKGIEKSVFLEELILENNIEIENKNLTEENINEIIKDALYKKRDFNIERNTMELKKDFENLKDNQISLGTYDVIMLSSCEYKYFLNKIMKLEKEEELVYGTSLRLLGTTVHKIFEQVGIIMREQIEKSGNFKVDEQMVDKYIRMAKKSDKMKIPVYVDIYLNKIIYPAIKNSIFEFYNYLEKRFKNKKINSFYSEKEKVYKSDYSKLKENPEILIKGRIDLAIETSTGNTLIDYKTGGKQDGQLDIYSLIMYGGDMEVEKIMYNVFKLEGKVEDKNIFTRESLNNIFLDFVKLRYYKRTDKKTMCNNCDYINICRREESYKYEENIKS